MTPATREPNRVGRLRLARGPAPPPPPYEGGRLTWETILGWTLCAYAVLGKGWAYLGASPFYIGELVLLLGCARLLVSGGLPAVFGQIRIWPLLLLMIWCASRTVPYVSIYGVETLRDAATWGYGVFAVIVFGSVILRPDRLGTLAVRYRQFSRIFVATIPFVWFAARALESSMPNCPWAAVPIIYAKPGDALVHLSGVLAFWVSGLNGPVGKLRVAVLATCSVAFSSYSRGGQFSFFAVFTMCLLLRPHDRSLRLMVGGLIAALTFLAVTNIQIEVPGRGRSLSFWQLVENVTSVATESDAGDLDGTKKWRLNWWEDIINYTFHGPHFWTGKGFGINLADDDGYQVDEGNMLRSPHNGHLSMLARVGVPALFLWGFSQLYWVFLIGRGIFLARRDGDEEWAGLFAFLLAYWVSFMINATFDVYIEGPTGGIWFWTIYGAGLSATWAYSRHPWALRNAMSTLPPPETEAGPRPLNGPRPHRVAHPR